MTTLPALSPDENAHTHLVPPVLHQIWIGSPPPPHVLKNWATWEGFIDQNDPDRQWTVHRWTEETLAEHPLLAAVRTTYGETMSVRGTTDMIRLWLVHLFGGVYMDCDTLPLRNLHTHHNRTAWIGEQPGREDKNRTVVWNGGFGMPARHPFPTAVLLHADAQLARGVRDDHHVAGPRAFRQILNRLPDTHRPEVTRNVQMEFQYAMRQVIKGRRDYDLNQLREDYPEPIAVIHP